MIAAVKGYRLQIAMSSAVSIERQKMIRAFGAEIIITDAKDGTDGAIKEVRRRIEENPELYFTPTSLRISTIN